MLHINNSLSISMHSFVFLLVSFTAEAAVDDVVLSVGVGGAVGTLISSFSFW